MSQAGVFASLLIGSIVADVQFTYLLNTLIHAQTVFNDLLIDCYLLTVIMDHCLVIYSLTTHAQGNLAASFDHFYWHGWCIGLGLLRSGSRVQIPSEGSSWG